jgi:hypothetical protein
MRQCRGGVKRRSMYTTQLRASQPGAAGRELTGEEPGQMEASR